MHHEHFYRNENFEDAAEAARKFGRVMRDFGEECGRFCHENRGYFEDAFRKHAGSMFDYPQSNIFIANDGSMILEFALPGFEEKEIEIFFQGDYLVLSARANGVGPHDDDVQVLRNRFKPRNIEKQKYRVPANEYAQDKVRAVFKTSILTITVPPKEESEPHIEIKIEGV